MRNNICEVKHQQRVFRAMSLPVGLQTCNTSRAGSRRNKRDRPEASLPLELLATSLAAGAVRGS